MAHRASSKQRHATARRRFIYKTIELLQRSFLGKVVPCTSEEHVAVLTRMRREQTV